MSNASPLHPADQQRRGNMSVALMVIGIVILAIVLVVGVAIWSQYRVESLPVSDQEKRLFLNAAQVFAHVDPAGDRDLLVRLNGESYFKYKYPDGMIATGYRFRGDQSVLGLEIDHERRIYPDEESARLACRSMTDGGLDMPNESHWTSETIDGVTTATTIDLQGTELWILSVAMNEDEFVDVTGGEPLSPVR